MDTHSLDIEDFNALRSYLLQTSRISAEQSPSFTNLAGGVSNRTVLVEFPEGRAWVLKQALAKLRVKVEWLSDPRRIEREAQGMRRLAELAPPGTITPLVFLDPAFNLLAMEAVPQPHENWKQMLMAGRVDLAHVKQFGAMLGQIHRRGWERREELSAEFADRSFFESLRLEPYYLYTADQVPAAAGFLRDLVAETRATRQTLVHGDYSPKNILVHNDRLILLDHEVIHFGDGAFDLGFSLAHFLSKAHHLRQHRAIFAGAASLYWSAYREALGDVPWANDLERRAVGHTLGCLLARCRGRSPLEYLDEAERAGQADVVAGLVHERPTSIGQLTGGFLARL
ncbi:MAG TPA: phosphotransferase [Tepidisphaeraceae bacterium]|jgi:aminoglycoside phosphotransferase (APT) family kinase protein|nr:phosphotransferase [Tepidisphaeraceae bacterium]